MKRFWACLAVLAGLAGPGQAAEIETLSDQPIAWEDRYSGACTHRLAGPIEVGDAAKLEAAINALPGQDHDDKNFIICLDSPGGNLAEGLAIGALIKSNWFGTYVPAGAECLSACAMAFMHGEVAAFEFRDRLRMLHPAGRLGFHAPSLSLPQGGEMMVPMSLVEAAYGSALLNLAEIVESAIGTSARYRTIPLPLLAELLRTPSEEFREVETLRDAFRWKIDIFPHGLTAPSDFDLEVGYYQLCASIYYELAVDSFVAEVMTPEIVGLLKTMGTYAPPRDRPGYRMLVVGQMDDRTCQVAYDNRRDVFDVYAFVDGRELGNSWLKPVYLFSPETRLRDLVPR